MELREKIAKMAYEVRPPTNFAQPIPWDEQGDFGREEAYAAADAILAILPDFGEPAAYLRDLDGTGSLHVCAKGDPGAVPLYR